MSGWGEFTAVFLAFYASHMIPAQPAIRGRLMTVLGKRFYMLLYALLSILLLAWLIGAATRAPFSPLWERAQWQSLLPQVLMLPACLLATFGAGARGGLSLGSQAETRLDPARPGIAAITRHPLLWALAFWSLGHLAPNGDLAHIILFGSFALTALLGMAAFDRRAKRRYEDKHWRQVLKVTAFFPCGSGFDCGGVDRPWLRGFFGILLYVTILALHAPLIGVSPT